MTNFDTKVTVKSGEPLLITVPLKAKFYNPAGSASVTDINPAELTNPTSFVTIAKQSGNIPVYPNNGDENYYYIEGSNLIFSLAPLPMGTHSLTFQAFLKNAYFSCVVAIDAKTNMETTEVTTETLNIDAIGDGQGDIPLIPTNYIETQASLPTGLTAEDLNRHCIVDNQLYKVVQDGSDYVWQKIKNLYSNVILFGYGSWIMTDEQGVELNTFQWRKPDGSAIAWTDVSSYIHNEIVTQQTHTTTMSGISSQGWQVQESIYICMQDTERPTYNLMFELQSVFLDGSKGWSATCLERTIEASGSTFERAITQTFHMFYIPSYASNGRLTKEVMYGDVMVVDTLPAVRDIHYDKCAIVGNKLYKCSNVSGSYQWVEVPIGKDNVIIDVTTLPTTDIQTDSLYRVAGQVLYEGTDVTPFGLYKFTEFGIENGCIADANSITVLNGVNQPETYSWENFNAVDIYNNMLFSGSIEETHVPTEANFALIDTLPPSPGTSKTNIARHISVCEIIPAKLYHYKDNTWVEIQPTTDNTLTTTDKTIVGSINELNTNKAPMDNVKVTGNITWGADLFWDIDTVITSEMKIKLATVNIPFLGTGNCNGTMIIIERRASATAESQLFIEFYVNQSSNNSQVQSPYNKFFLSGTLDASYNGQFKTYFDNIAWSDWQRVEIGSHNTFTSSIVKSIDECIFPFIYHRGNRTFKDSRVYLASMINPISETTINGECQTVEVTRSEKLIVEQTFTRFNSSENTRIVYFRRGVYTFSTQTGDWGDNTDVIANIVWQDWYPIEYPQTSLTLNTGWEGEIRFSITGGIATLYFVNLAKTSSATSNLPINSSSAPGTGLIALPIKYVVWGTIFKTDDVTLVKAVWRQNEGLTISTNIVQDAQYLGTLQIPLGY